MSDHNPFIVTLKKISITVIHLATDGAFDPYTLEDCFHYADRIRMIIGPVQVMGFNRSSDGGYDLVLRFSPDYLGRNYYKLLGVNANFEWVFTLPKYTITDYVDENGNDQCDELGMVEWLTQSVVTVEEANLANAHWSHEEFQASFNEFV